MPVGRTKDAGWEIGVSRTVPCPPERAWEVLTSPEGVRAWLGEGLRLPAEAGTLYELADGTVGEVRSFHPLDRVRLTRRATDSYESTVQVAISPAAHGTTVRFHEERLPDGDERERRRVHWRSVMDRLVDLF